MALDPQVRALLDERAKWGLPPAHKAPSIAAARDNMLARLRLAPVAEEPVGRVENRAIPGPGGDLPVRIYWPSGSGPFPILVYFHGGGWVVGNLDTHDAVCRSLTNDAGCVTVSVDYRLAPEAKFPGPVEDCYAATVWASKNAASLNADAARLAVGGDSAGGNLAAAVALMARDRGGLPIRFQLLIYPVTDRDFTVRSYVENAEGYGLMKADMEWYWEQYLSSDADAQNPYAAPLRATNLRGLPPALVITAGYDVLRDEGEAYARALEAADVPTRLAQYPGLNHGFFGLAPWVDKAREGVGGAAQALKDALAPR
jgi:acetyl esterase